MARAGTARSACVLSPAGFGNQREGTYARAVLLASRRTAQHLDRYAGVVAGGPVRRTLAFGHLVARPWRIPADEAAGAMRNLARSPGFEATLEAIGDHRLRRPRRSAARSPSPGGRRTGCCSTRARAPAPAGCCPTPAT